MLRHYVKTALRHLRREKGYALLNATGLALGLACAFLAVLYIRDETSFDRFHAGGERLLMLASADTLDVPQYEATPYPLAPLLADMPEVEMALRADWGSKRRMRRPGGQEVELRLLLTEPGFFSFFSFPLVHGSAAALDAPDGAVLTRKGAQALFGSADPTGEVVEYYKPWPAPGRWVPLQVAAVAADPPATSTVQFDAVANLTLLGEEQLAPDGWGASWLRTYARLRQGVDFDAYAPAMTHRVAATDTLNGRRDRRFVAMPLADYYFSDLHSGSSFTGRRGYLRLFGAIALVVLLIAMFNYVNLSTVRSLRRAREVGVRKAVGAEGGQVARQMLVEAVLLATGAFGVALALVWMVLPAFNGFFGKSVALSPLRDADLLLALLGGAVLTGALAGLYPAFVLARYRPTTVLKAGTPGGPGGAWLRRGLVVAQFAATVGLLVYTGILFNQIDYLRSRYPLPEKARLVTLEVPNEWQHRTPTLKAALRALPGVNGVTATTAVPGQVRNSYGVRDSLGNDYWFAGIQADRDYADVMRLDLVHQAPGTPAGPLRLFLNETAMKTLGKPWAPGVTAPLGLVNNGISGSGESEVAGVMRNFPFASLREPIEPLFLAEGADTLDYWMIVARVEAARLADFLSALPGVWAQFSALPPEPEYVDDYVAELYKAETQLAQIVTFFSLLALLVACLGLFGLAAFAAAQRTKEIGIRKSLGASTGSIVGLLSRDFVGLVVAACLVAMPAAYVVARRWLEGFVEQAPITPLVFAVVALGALVLALVTVGGHAWRAARANPVRSLRYE